MHRAFQHTLRAASALIILVGLGSVVIAYPPEPTMADMQWQRRVLILSTPDAADQEYAAQQRALAQWHGGDERDVTVVRIVGAAVSGAREAAADLRKRYDLPAATFSAALIGKDGHVALRSQRALGGAQLDAVIDAMPMRKAGQR